MFSNLFFIGKPRINNAIKEEISSHHCWQWELVTRVLWKSWRRYAFGHLLIGEDDAEEHETLSSDSNIEEIVDVEQKDEVEFVDWVESVPRKQRFFNLYDVLNLKIYGILPEQEPSQFHYTDLKGQFTMTWNTLKQYQSGRAPSWNFLRHQPGPSGPASVTNPFEPFSLFITDDMLNTMIDYANANIRHFLLKFREAIEQSDKNTHCKATVW